MTLVARKSSSPWTCRRASRQVLIEEFIGRVNSGTSGEHRPAEESFGLVGAGQRPEFDEYTVVLKRSLDVKLRRREYDVGAGQAIIVKAGEWVQYRAVAGRGRVHRACLPACSPETAHRQ